jgi:hypothetical protein
VLVELGVAQVAADQYEEALKSFLTAGDWLDAAWISERLLTTDELIAFVDTWFPRTEFPPDAGQVGRTGISPHEVPGAMRHLLARRLAREGRWTRALPYFEWRWSHEATQVRDALVKGRDPSVPDAERGALLWNAALILKSNGWDLLATEMEPDFRVEHGYYELVDTTEARRAASDPGGLFAASHTELARLGAHEGRTERYQFVYTAWELANEAVALLPDDSELLAQAACTSGTWMSSFDVRRSSEMWLVLLRRAYNTDIGQSTTGRAYWWGLNEEGLCEALPAPPAPRAPEPEPWPLGAGILVVLIGISVWRRSS